MGNGWRTNSGLSGWAALALAMLGIGCASSGDASGGGSTETVGPLCADCVTATAGGQTTDFGGGGGCQYSLATPIDGDTATALGFVGIDLIERSFDESLRWTPRATTGQPASGYDAQTRVHGETTLLGFDQMINVDPATNVAGPTDLCPGYVRANLGVTLSTADQAISIAGELHASGSKPGAQPGASGKLDLKGAVGTLVLRPDSSPEPLTGTLGVNLTFLPDSVRGNLSVDLFTASDEPSSSEPGPGPSYVYAPLMASFPDDACKEDEVPMLPDEFGATPDGGSASDMVAKFAAIFGTDPLPAAWSDGRAVTVTTRLGKPRNVCVELFTGNLAYQVPFGVTSSDGRVHIDELASGVTTFDETGNMTGAYVTADHLDPVPSAAFPAASHITGVDLADWPEAIWYADIAPVPGNPQTAPWGGIEVFGNDPNADPMRSIDALATLSWSK